MDNPETLATLGIQDIRGRQIKQDTQHFMGWVLLCPNKYTVRK